MYRTLQTTIRDKSRQLFDSIKRLVPSPIREMNPIYIFPGGGIGETVYTLSLSPHLRPQNQIVIALPQNVSWLAKCFPDSYDFALTYPTEYSELVLELFDISAARPDYPLVVRPDLIGDGRFCKIFIIENSRINFAEAHAYLLGLPLNSKLVEPTATRVKNLSKESSSLRNVLLIHHANTMPPLPDIFWLKLYKSISNLGVSVQFDAFGRQIDPSLASIELIGEQILDLSSRFDTIVSLRSGLSDLIASTLVNKTTCLITIYNTLDGATNHPSHLCKPGVSKSGMSIHEIWKNPRYIDVEIPEIETGLATVTTLIEGGLGTS